MVNSIQIVHPTSSATYSVTLPLLLRRTSHRSIPLLVTDPDLVSPARPVTKVSGRAHASLQRKEGQRNLLVYVPTWAVLATYTSSKGLDQTSRVECGIHTTTVVSRKAEDYIQSVGVRLKGRMTSPKDFKWGAYLKAAGLAESVTLRLGNYSQFP